VEGLFELGIFGHRTNSTVAVWRREHFACKLWSIDGLEIYMGVVSCACSDAPSDTAIIIVTLDG